MRAFWSQAVDLATPSSLAAATIYTPLSKNDRTIAARMFRSIMPPELSSKQSKETACFFVSLRLEMG